MKILLKDSDLFFKKNKAHFIQDLTQVAVLGMIFSALSALTIAAGWTTVKLVMGIVESIAVFFLSILGGVFITSALLALMVFRTLDKESFKKAFFIVTYAATPALVLGWIPHGFVKLIGIIWSLVFVAVGIEVGMNKTQKQAVTITIALAVTLALLTFISQNFLLSPI
ncbi:MAG: YIP1 family protein [Candidatus Aenigmarchaeota archaeon]|nr:YIP1 family protein [Candidatus Aenigmarchaeota archaeon]